MGGRVRVADHRSPDTARTLLALAQRAYASEAALVGVALPPQRQTLAQLMNDPGRFLVWRQEAGAAGLISWESAGPDICITRLCVRASCRRRGIAAALLEACLAHAGPDAVAYVTTAAVNAPGLAFYASHGFAQVSEQVTAEGIALVCLRRRAGRET